MRIVAARGFEPRPHVCCPYTTRQSGDERLNAVLQPPCGLQSFWVCFAFEPSAIIAPMCYASPLLAFVKSYVSMSKSRFVLWKRGDSNPLYISNVHQSSVVIRASPIAPLPCACLSRLSSQEPQIAKRSLVFRYNV